MAKKIKYKETDLISYVVETHPKAEEILTSFGFHCIYCPAAQMETLLEACAVHDVNVVDLLAALNK